MDSYLWQKGWLLEQSQLGTNRYHETVPRFAGTVHYCTNIREGWEAYALVTFVAEISVQIGVVRRAFSNSWQQTANRELMDPGETDCLIKTKQRDSLTTGVPSL